MECKDVMYPDFIGLYKVYSNGAVYSIRNRRFLKQGTKPEPANYKFVVLCNKGLHIIKHVHSVVADHFLVKPNVKGVQYDVNHKDMDKSNNDVSNLEYITHQQNILHARQNKEWASNWTENRRLNYKYTDSTRLKMSLAKQKKCMIYNDNEQHTFNSIADLVDYLHIDRKQFNRYAFSCKTLKGFTIRYL